MKLSVKEIVQKETGIQDGIREHDADTWLSLEPLSLQLGMDLISLANEKKTKNIIKSILQIRSSFSEDMGLVIPPIRIKDNHKISGGQYRILLRGEEVAAYEVYPRQIRAITSGDDLPPLRHAASLLHSSTISFLFLGCICLRMQSSPPG